MHPDGSARFLFQEHRSFEIETPSVLISRSGCGAWFLSTLSAAPARCAQSVSTKSIGNHQPQQARSLPLVTGEKIPSEDPLIKNFHSLGLIEGRVNIFRCASPTRDLVKDKPLPGDRAALAKFADATRLKHLAELGIHTIISLENPDSTEDGDASSKAQQTLWMALEKQAAKDAGIAFISHPLINSGPGSMQTMSDEEVAKLIDPIAADILAQSKTGGVLFHCAAGHDRTGIVAAYIRLKWEQWPIGQTIEEMRRLGHNWEKYSSNGGVSSWHEEHLKAMADLLKMPADATLMRIRHSMAARAPSSMEGIPHLCL